MKDWIDSIKEYVKDFNALRDEPSSVDTTNHTINDLSIKNLEDMKKIIDQTMGVPADLLRSEVERMTREQRQWAREQHQWIRGQQRYDEWQRAGEGQKKLTVPKKELHPKQREFLLWLRKYIIQVERGDTMPTHEIIQIQVNTEHDGVPTYKAVDVLQFIEMILDDNEFPDFPMNKQTLNELKERYFEKYKKDTAFKEKLSNKIGNR